MNTTTTGPLSAGGASGTLAVTVPGINIGTAAIPVYAAPAVADTSKPYAALSASPDFVGCFALYRDVSSIGGGAGCPQLVCRGDNTTLRMAGATPLATLAGTDALTLAITAYAGGSLALSVAQ